MFATKSVSNIVKFKQPDGTVVHLKIVGDELFGYKQTMQGDVVEVGTDGYLYYTRITLSGKEITSHRVSPEGFGLYSAPSEYLLSKIREQGVKHFCREDSNLPNSPFAGLANLTKSEGNEYKFLVLLVQFQDIKFSVPDPKGSFHSMLNTAGYSENGATGSVADYFHDNFNGSVDFSFIVPDVITLDSPISTYGAPDRINNDVNVKMMVKQAVESASGSGVDFSQFDNNLDGVVDNVAIIFAGHSEAEGGAPNSIWPHQTSIITENLLYNGVKIGSYSCSAELAGAQGEQMAAIGTFCHEFIHSFGVPDMYDVNGEEEGASPGLYGTISIMDRGNFLNSGKTPPYLTSIEREIMGFTPIMDLYPEEKYTLLPVHKSTSLYRVPTSVEGEYFLVESRGSGEWDAYIGGEGMVIYHLDKSSNEVAGVEAVKRWDYNNVNSFASHECARVIPADAVDSQGAIFFPGSSGVTKLNSTTGYLPLRGWNGYGIGLGFEKISYSKGTLNFSTITDSSYDNSLPRAVECISIPYQSDARVEWMGATNMEEDSNWMVRYRVDDESSLWSCVIVDTTMCYIGGLAAGVEYEVLISFLDGAVSGPATKLMFKTKEISSMFPYIHVKEESYRVGERVDLRVFNLVEEHVVANWYLDGKIHDKPWCIFTDGGKKEIKLEIVYRDGSKENIYKTITVK